MTQEEKQILLKDLCARLIYGVMCDRLGQPKKLLSVSPNKDYCIELDNGVYSPNEYKIEDVKPYLRPMASMTEEERNELSHYENSVQRTDFLYSHHIDCRYMIEKGLALEAPEDIYKNI